MQLNIELSENDVKEIITKYLKEQGYNDIKDVAINVGNISTGYGSSERDVPAFKSITATVKNKQS